MMASPAERVSTTLFSPMMPREGMLNSMCIRSPLFSMESSSPLRRVMTSMILLADSSGRFTVSCSTGSCFSPAISLMITCGWPTCSSYPSRRMVSISTERWSTPRPYTIQESELPVSSTRSARFLSSSRISRS